MDKTSPQHQDVRQRGFGSLHAVQTALDFLKQHRTQPPQVLRPLAAAQFTTLAQEIIAPVSVPSYRRAAMDGFALCQVSQRGQIVGTAKANVPYTLPLQPGQAVKIMTGAPVPDSADVVIPIESCEIAGDQITLQVQLPPGKNIIAIGEDVIAGQTLFTQHHRLRPQDLGLLASLGFTHVPVLQPHRVQIVVTGNEIVPVGQTRTEFQIVDSNSMMLEGLISRDGGQVLPVRYLADDPIAIERMIIDTAWDVLLIIGGTSVGIDDHAPNVLREHAKTFFHGFHMKPGMPTGLGQLADQRWVVLLPGNPIACFFAYELFTRDMITHGAAERPIKPCQLRAAIPSMLGRTDMVPIRLFNGEAEPLLKAGAANLSRLTMADGFIIIPETIASMNAGDMVNVNIM